MISAYKAANYLSKNHKVVVLTTGRPAKEVINHNLTVYRMWDIFLPDPINYSIVPGLLFSLLWVIKKERPTHFMVNKHMFFTSFSVFILRLMGKPVITVTDTFPGINWLPRKEFVRKVMRLYSTLFGVPILKASTKVVLLHEELITIAQKLKLNYTIIHNGVDLAQVEAATASAELLTQEYLTIIYVGRLESVKGYTDILAVAKKMTVRNKKLRFIFVGNTKGKEEMVATESTKQIMFLGHRTDVLSLMKASDIFVMASYSEGLPNALMEAMACALPSVCSAVGGIKILIQDGKNGLLFPAGEQETMIKQLEHLISDSGLRKKLGVAARHTIEAEYSWENISDQYAQLFQQISPTNTPS